MGLELGHSTNPLGSKLGCKVGGEKAQHQAGFEPTTSRAFDPEAPTQPLYSNDHSGSNKVIEGEA